MAAITDPDRLQQCHNLSPVHKLYQGRISYGSHNQSGRISYGLSPRIGYWRDRLSRDRYDTIALGLLKKEEEEEEEEEEENKECQIAIYFFYFARCLRKIALYSAHSIGNQPYNTMVVFKMRDSLPSARYSSVCNVMRLWNISLIHTYRVYRLYDLFIQTLYYDIFCVFAFAFCTSYAINTTIYYALVCQNLTTMEDSVLIMRKSYKSDYGLN